jgi:protein AATF/BFR2
MSSFRDTSKKRKKKKKHKDAKKKSSSSKKNKRKDGLLKYDIEDDSDSDSKNNKRKKDIEKALEEFNNSNALVDPDAFDTDFQDGTSASASTHNSKFDSRNIDSTEFGPSGRLNLRGGIDMDDDEKYSGKTITRKQLVKAKFGDGENDDDEDDGETRKQLENAYLQRESYIEFNEEQSTNDDSSDGDSDYDESSFTNSNSNNNNAFHDSSSSNIANELKRIEQEDRHALMKLSASKDDDIARAKHTKNQMALYDDFLRLRISMQSIVSSVNRFPQPDVYPLFEEKMNSHENRGQNTNVNLDSNLNLIMETMSNLLSVQSTLISRNKNVRENVNKYKRKRVRQSKNENKYSNSSSSEDDNNGADSNVHKYTIDEMWEKINGQNQDIYNYDRDIIQKWDEKIRLQSSTNHKALKAVNRTVLSQIDALMADTGKIVERTRTHPTPVKVLGKDNTFNESNNTSLLQDDEVYNDNDFYQMQLKEFISSSSIDDAERSRLETKVSFKLKKTKRNVDTKASKGRRLKFTPHSKLLNFMAPQPQEDCMIDVEGLIGSLFERIPAMQK